MTYPTGTREGMRNGLEALVESIPTNLSAVDARDLVRIVERLVAAIRPDKIYLFGSQARGEATPDSDVDLLVIVPKTDRLPHQLDQEAYRVVAPHSLRLEILVMPRDEFDWRGVARRHRFQRRYFARADYFMHREALQDADDWLLRAERDLLTARRLLDLTPPLLDAVVCHTQQAAEKALKAFLPAQASPFPRTYNLMDLLRQSQGIDTTR